MKMIRRLDEKNITENDRLGQKILVKSSAISFNDLRFYPDLHLLICGFIQVYSVFFLIPNRHEN